MPSIKSLSVDIVCFNMVHIKSYSTGLATLECRAEFGAPGRVRKLGVPALSDIEYDLI